MKLRSGLKIPARDKKVTGNSCNHFLYRNGELSRCFTRRMQMSFPYLHLYVGVDKVQHHATQNDQSVCEREL